MIHLYIKTHLDTGLKYLGKTTRDPFKYSGSGKYWKRHLKTYGDNVHTLVLLSTDDTNLCTKFALFFSKVYDVVNSNGWANLRVENGTDGAPVGHEGHQFTEDELQRISEASKLHWSDPEFVEKMRAAQSKSWTEERRESQSAVSKTAWTEERKRKHSERIKQLRREGRYANASTKGRPKSEEHRRKISDALKGKRKKGSQ